MFIGRKIELEQMNRRYRSDKFQFVVMYGRRRVGKTFLLTEFIRDKKAIYFAAEQYNEKLLLEKFSAEILAVCPSNLFQKFDSFEQAIRYLAERAADERLILIIDEFQYWAQQNKALISQLQNLIDQLLLHTKLYLVLCGSYVSFMESEVLGYQSPLYGRRTAEFKLDPFHYKEAAEMLPGYDSIQMMQAYGVLGGMPMYLAQFDDVLSLKENIIDTVVAKGGLLHNEPLFALKQELRDPALYFSIIESIARGSSRYNEICTKVGVDCGAQLHALIQLGIVKKELPLGSPKTARKAIYKLQDNLFSFWFRFMSEGNLLIEQGKYELMYDRIIQPDLSNYMGHTYEDICIDLLAQANAEELLPTLFLQIGRWWGNHPKKRQEIEIDIMAKDADDTLLVGECKWRNAPVDLPILLNLIEKADMFPQGKKYYLLCSKSGYKTSLLEYGKKLGNVLILDTDTLEFKLC